MTIPFDQYSVAFGMISILLGLLGYLRAKSTASLVAGSISGLLLSLGGLAYQRGHLWGGYLALGMCVLLFARFLPAYLKTRKFYPAGVMAILAVIGTVVGALKLL